MLQVSTCVDDLTEYLIKRMAFYYQITSGEVFRWALRDFIAKRPTDEEMLPPAYFVEAQTKLFEPSNRKGPTPRWTKRMSMHVSDCDADLLLVFKQEVASRNLKESALLRKIAMWCGG